MISSRNIRKISIFRPGSIGVCEDSNSEALKLLMKNCVPVISCGMNGKNTVTLSSVGGSAALVSLQRTVTDIYGRDREPAEFRIRLTHSRSPFAVAAAAAALLLLGITPDEF